KYEHDRPGRPSARQRPDDDHYGGRPRHAGRGDGGGARSGDALSPPAPHHVAAPALRRVPPPGANPHPLPPPLPRTRPPPPAPPRSRAPSHARRRALTGHLPTGHGASASSIRPATWTSCAPSPGCSPVIRAPTARQSLTVNVSRAR